MLFEQISKIQLLIERFKFDLAERELAQALSTYPDSPDLYGLKTELLIKSDNYKEARQTIQTAISLGPEIAYLHFLHCQVLTEFHEYNKAIEAIDEALRLSPETAVYYGMKSNILIAKSNYAEAKEIALKGLEMDPSDLLCNNMLSMAQNKLGDKEDAYNRLKNMLEDDPENELTQSNLGYAYLQAGNPKKAKEHFAIALQLDPKFEFARHGMLEAIKSTNWIYRQLLLFSFWMDKIGNKNRWLFIVGLIFIVKLVPFLIPIYLVFIFWSWFTGPISEVMLYFDKYGKFLMTDMNRRVTLVNIFLIGISISSLAIGLLYNLGFLGIAAGCFAAIIPVYQLDGVVKVARKIALYGFILIFIGSGITILIMSLLGLNQVALVWMVLMISMVAFTWVVNLITN